MCKTVIWMLLMSMVLATTQTHESQYRQKRLIVEIEETVIATHDDWNAFLESSNGFGYTWMDNLDWDCYQGGMRISEEKFYEIAGFSECAEKAKSLRQNKQFFTYGGLAMSVIGLAMLVAHSQAASSDDAMQESGFLYAGLGMGVAGVTFTVRGFGMPTKSTVARFAVGVADEYNKQLRMNLEERK